MTVCIATHQFGDRRLGDLATCSLEDGHSDTKHVDVDGRWWSTFRTGPNPRPGSDVDDFTARALAWRGVTDPCRQCHGSGQRSYSSGATWRGGMGTTAITDDVCDTCWGTGDRFRTGCDLRRLRDEEQKRIAVAAVTLLAESVGASMSVTGGAIVQIIGALERIAAKRGAPAAQFLPEMATALAKTLRVAIGGGT